MKQSNGHEAGLQILSKTAQQEVFQYRELNANAANECRDNDMTLTKPCIKRMTKNLQPEIKTLDDLAEWCAMRKGEVQNHNASCFKRFANYTDYVDHNHDSTHFNNANHTWYNTVAVPETSFQCDEQAVHIFCCTGSTRWRKYKPPINVTTLLCMGTSPDSHFKLTVGSIPTWLKCLLIIEDTGSSVKGLVAVVQTFATGTIDWTAAMVIVEESHHSPMQLLHN